MNCQALCLRVRWCAAIEAAKTPESLPTSLSSRLPYRWDGGVGGNTSATKNAFPPPALEFRRNCKLLLNLCRAHCREETNLRPVTRGNSFVTKSGSHVLVSESFAERPSRAPPLKKRSKDCHVGIGKTARYGRCTGRWATAFFARARGSRQSSRASLSRRA